MWWFKRKEEPTEEVIVQLETYILSSNDSLEIRCQRAWRNMGFVNDRLGAIPHMVHIFEQYRRLDESYAAQFKPTHLHKKGRYYQVIGEGIIEESCTPAVIYKNDAGMTWIRPSEEFYDGRFTPIEEIEDVSG